MKRPIVLNLYGYRPNQRHPIWRDMGVILKVSIGAWLCYVLAMLVML